MKRSTLLFLSLGAIATTALAGLALTRKSLPAAATAAPPTPLVRQPAARLSGGSVKPVPAGFAGYGWSTLPDTPQAVQQTLAHATADTAGPADIAAVFFSPRHSAQQVQHVLRGGPHTARRVFGISTHEGILCADGYITAPTGVVGLLTMRSASILPGVGGASFDEATPPEAAKLALRRAIADAGSSALGQKPALILLGVTLPNEEAVLAALASETGTDVPLIGGTVAGTVDPVTRKKNTDWSMIVNDKVIKNGVAIAVFFSPQEFAWSFGGGYRRSSISGIVTKCQPRLILEIDGRPAAEVYDQWLGGRVTEAAHRGESVINFCTLYPLCRTPGTHNQFIRVWPNDDPKLPGSLRTGASVKQGDTVYLSEGTWNILLNHFASIPQKARESGPGSQSLAGLFFYCGGALDCIPNDQRPQMAFLVGQSMRDIPWMGVFTWGEQGNVPGVGNLHSNLSACTAFFPVPAAANR